MVHRINVPNSCFVTGGTAELTDGIFFGVPLGLFAAFACHLPIQYVYFILSLEECVRFVISVAVFRRRKWMQSLRA